MNQLQWWQQVGVQQEYEDWLDGIDRGIQWWQQKGQRRGGLGKASEVHRVSLLKHGEVAAQSPRKRLYR